MQLLPVHFWVQLHGVQRGEALSIGAPGWLDQALGHAS